MNATFSVARQLERLVATGTVLLAGEAPLIDVPGAARWEPGQSAAPAGPFDAIVWSPASDAAVEQLGGGLRTLRERLANGGSLAVALPVTGDQERLARPDQTALRAVVRALSEDGWCIRRDEAEGEHRLLIARPDGLRIRAYLEGDEDAILQLFRASFHAQRDLSHWRWKYLDSPFGSRRISLAFADDALVSHYGGYPMPVSIALPDGARCEGMAMQMGDTMTHPEYRDRGRGRSALLPRTVRHFFSLHRNAATTFYFGFNTGPIQRFCEWFIGGFFAEPVGFWVRPSDSAAEAVSRRGYRIEEVQTFGNEWNRFFERCAPAYGTLVRRDAAYLDWRYRRCPDVHFVTLAARRFGRLVGMGVFRRQADRLLWGDALFDPRHVEAAAPLLSSALRHPELSGTETVECWSSARPTWWVERLRTVGFARQVHPQGLGMVALSNGEPATPGRIRELCYTMGDGDLF